MYLPATTKKIARHSNSESSPRVEIKIYCSNLFSRFSSGRLARRGNAREPLRRQAAQPGRPVQRGPAGPTRGCLRDCAGRDRAGQACHQEEDHHQAALFGGVQISEKSQKVRIGGHFADCFTTIYKFLLPVFCFVFRRGIYLACVLYHEDKLLLTNEDFVPVIEIDETFTSNLHTDFYWLMKVGTTDKNSDFILFSFHRKKKIDTLNLS